MATDNNRIEVEDIVAKKDILDALKEITDGLEGLKTEIGNVAQAQKIELKNIISTSGMEKASERVNALVKALEALNIAYQQNQNAVQAVTQAQVRQAVADKAAAEARMAQAKADREQQRAANSASKAARDLANNLADLAKIQGASDQERLQELKTLEAEKMSFDQLSATYRAIKQVLNGVTQDQIAQNESWGAAQKKLAELYDAMNKYQQASGKFQMNVGNYKRAFDGLGYSITQVVREIPSAINIQQFFLAISNNIPMVADEFKKFSDSQKDIQENLKKMRDMGEEGTEAFKKLEGQIMTLGQKLKATFTSFGMIASVVTILITKLPQIIGFFRDWIKGVDVLNRETKSLTAQTLTLADAAKKYGQSVEELNLIESKIGDINRGTSEWKSAIERVNEICHSNLSATSATAEEVKRVTQAYKEQAKQMAINKAVAERISQSEINKRMREIANQMVDAHDYESLATMLGYKPDSKQYKELEKNLKIKSGISLDFSNSQARVNRVKNIINAAYPILEEAAYKSLEDMVKIVDDPNMKPKSGKTSSKTHKQVEDLARQFAMVESNSMDASIEQRLQLIDDKMEQEKIALEKFVEKQAENYAYNKKNGLLTKEDEETFKRLQEQYIEILDSLPKKYEKLKDDELLKYNKEILAQNKKMTQQQMDMIELEIKEGEVAIPKRVKSKEDEIKKNTIIQDNIDNIRKAMEKLEQTKVWDDEQLTIRNKKLAEMNKRIENLKNSMQFDQQLKNYKNFWDMVGANGVLEGVGGSDKKGFLEKLGIVGVNDDNAESVFDLWVTNASAALKEMSEELGSYLSDMLDSWANFYDGQADLAAQNTEAAKNYWEEQKQLAKDGYANEVETAWATYQERQRQQERAEQLAQQWASVSQYVSDMESGANLAVAVSNLLKQFTAIPGVGLPLAVGAVATLMKMWGTYKSQIKSVATYGDGGYEALVGGSHASGHDIDMGFNNRAGKRVHTEGGEAWAVFNRRAVSKYGHRQLRGLVQGVNAGTLATNALNDVGRGVNVHVNAVNETSMAKVERLLESIDRNGNEKTYVLGDGTMVIKNGNATKRIRR